MKDHIFDSKECDSYVKANVYESYLQHALISANFSQRDKDEYLARVGTILQNLKTIRELEIKSAEEPLDELRAMRIAGLKADINLELDDLPDTAFLNSLTLSCGWSVFFEVLVMSIKSNCLTYQAHVFKTKMPGTEN